MRLGGLLATAALGLAGCAPNVDVVGVQSGDSGSDAPETATPLDGAPRDASADEAAPPSEAAPPIEAATEAGVDAPPDAPLPPACDPTAAASIYLADKTGALTRLSPASGLATTLGPADCAAKLLGGFVASMAVGVDGTVWVVGSTGNVVQVNVTGKTPVCTRQVPIQLTVSGDFPRVSLLPAPAPAPPPLYAYESGMLVAFDSLSFFEAPISKLDGSNLLGLSATFDGRLYAVRADPKPAVADLDLLDPGTGAVASTLTVPLPGAASFQGGAYAAGAFYLFGDAFYYALDLGTQVLGPPLKATMPLAGVVAMAAAACPAPK